MPLVVKSPFQEQVPILTKTVVPTSCLVLLRHAPLGLPTCGEIGREDCHEVFDLIQSGY